MLFFSIINAHIYIYIYIYSVKPKIYKFPTTKEKTCKYSVYKLSFIDLNYTSALLLEYFSLVASPHRICLSALSKSLSVFPISILIHTTHITSLKPCNNLCNTFYQQPPIFSHILYPHIRIKLT